MGLYSLHLCIFCSGARNLSHGRDHSDAKGLFACVGACDVFIFHILPALAVHLSRHCGNKKVGGQVISRTAP